MHKIGAFYYLLAAGVREAGITDVEVALTHARANGITELDISKSDAKPEFLTLLKNTDMRVASTHAVLPCEYASKEKYAESLAKMKDAIDRALLVGSPNFMCVPKPPADMPECDKEAFFEAVRREFSDICDYAKSLPITVTVENASLHNVPFASFEDIDCLLAANPTLMVTLDGGNFTLAGIDELEGAKRYASRITYVHMKDLKITDGNGIVRGDVTYCGTHLGGGFLKNLETLKALKAASVTSTTVTIETASTVDLFAETLKSAEWLKAAIATV